MSLLGAIADYFIIWWLMLFLTLPFGVRNAHEAGVQVEQGNEPGAPVRHLMWRKVVATTVLAALVFAVVLLVLGGELVSLDDFWFIGPPAL
jgi:predicted secreted protein